jgi:hypothetical protein
MKSKLKKIGMIALFLVTGSQEQVMKMFGESPAPVSNEAKAQVYNYPGYAMVYCGNYTFPSGYEIHRAKCETGSGICIQSPCG